jgi:integrase/recombinase XerD
MDNILMPQSHYQQLISQYIANLDILNCTKDAYKKALQSWSRFIYSNEIHDNINPILQYKNYLILRKLSAYTIATYISSLRLFFDFLVKQKVIVSNPAREISITKLPKGKRNSLTKEEAKNLLSLNFNNSAEELRNKAILHLKIFTGLRDISIVEANIEDIKAINNRYVLYYKNKGSQAKEHFVVLDNIVYYAINNYLIKRQNPSAKEPLFVSHSDRNNNKKITTQTLRHVIKNLLKRAGIIRADIKPHSLRHSAITFSILGGADIAQARDMAAHKDINTTSAYFHDIRRISNPAELYIKDYIFQEERLTS